MNRRNNVQKTVLAAVLAALTCAATLLHVPTINGYANLGDCMVLVCAWTLGPIYGTFAAGLGSALADLILSYALYAPATFAIKALMALAAYFVFSALSILGIRSAISRAIGAVIAEILMISGYFAFESVVYGIGGAIPSLVTNAAQGVVGAVGGILLYEIVLGTHMLGGNAR